MEPKPFSIKSPEEVASAYGGNKQKIAQAIQMGALDPTSGLLAGMFIDRMRSAQVLEQAPQQTVAQKVLAPSAPPAPPAGLGAIGPQGGGMAAPPPSAPPAGLGAMPPVGMAAGGMTELPTSYGLENLPIPDNMYDEQSFAGGGIVAFADGRKVDAKAERRKALMSVISSPNYSFDERRAANQELNTLMGTSAPGLAELSLRSAPETAPVSTPNALPSAPQSAVTPKEVLPSLPPPRGERGIADIAPRATRTGTGAAPTTSAEPDYLAALKPKEVPALGATTEEFKKLFGEIPAPPGTSAEEKAARKNEDLWSTLAQIGFGMAAGESPNFLTNVGKATAAAIPGMQEALKERRADTKEELKQQYAYDLARHGLNKDAVAAAVARTDSLKKDELTKLVTATELQAKAVEGARDRAVQMRGQKITADYYNNLSNKEQREFDFKAKVIADAEGISMAEARNKLLQMEFARRTGKTNNAEDTLARVRGLGGKDGNLSGLKYLGVEPEGD